MSTRAQLAAVVQTYRLAVVSFALQSRLADVDLTPVIRFLEAHQARAEAALKERDAEVWEQQQADAIRGAAFGDLFPAHIEYPQDAAGWPD